MNNCTQTAEIYRNRVRIETLETALADAEARIEGLERKTRIDQPPVRIDWSEALARAETRIEALETALATEAQTLVYRKLCREEIARYLAGTAKTLGIDPKDEGQD